MGYFAVLAPEADKTLIPYLSVGRLHVNLWGLRGLWPGRRLFFLDVGVELKLEDDDACPDDAEISAVDALLPFRVEEGKWKNGAAVAQDLYDSVINEHSGSLVFGSPVRVQSTGGGQSTVEFESTRLQAARIAEVGVKAVAEHVTKADSSLYTIPLQHPVRKGESVYFRVRWRVFGAAPLWRWTRAESGARVDFRICDTRGVPSERDAAFLSRVLPVESAKVFIMAPDRLRPTNVGSEPKHVRTLEPGAWSGYLEGAAGRNWMARGLLVYGWHRKPDPGRPISEDDPYRVFLALNRAAGTAGWLNVVYSTVGVLLAWALLALSGPVSDLSIGDVDARSWMALIGVTSLTAAWNLMQRLRPFFADRARGPRQLIRRIERFILTL